MSWTSLWPPPLGPEPQPPPSWTEPPWPKFHAVDISHHDVWLFMCFYAEQIGSSVIERNLIPKLAMMGYVARFNYWFYTYDYERALAAQSGPGIQKPERMMADLTNEEIFVLLKAQYKTLGNQLDRERGNCRETLARMMELASMTKPYVPDPEGDNG